MTRDINILRTWFMIVFIIAVIGTNAVPIIYSFSPWRKHLIGKLFMIQGIAFAGAINVSLMFRFWRPDNILVLFWIQTLMFTGIAVATLTLAYGIWRMNHPRKRRLKLLFTSGVYEFLKKLVQYILPAAVTLWLVVGNLWNLPNVETVAGTITAVTAFLGACIGISTKTYNATEAKYDGYVVIQEGESGQTARFQDINLKSLTEKDHILLKVEK